MKKHEEKWTTTIIDSCHLCHLKSKVSLIKQKKKRERDLHSTNSGHRHGGELVNHHGTEQESLRNASAILYIPKLTKVYKLTI